MHYFAKRFAEKEAFSKAIGTVFRKNLSFKDIQVLKDNLRKPYYSRPKKIEKIINQSYKKKNYNLFLSITDEKDYTIAFVILQAK